MTLSHTFPHTFFEKTCFPTLLFSESVATLERWNGTINLAGKHEGGYNKNTDTTPIYSTKHCFGQQYSARLRQNFQSATGAGNEPVWKQKRPQPIKYLPRPKEPAISFRDLSGALGCTTKPVRADTPEEELMLAWESEGRQQFNMCHRCGKWVSDAMYNSDVPECVECTPWEEEPEYCPRCGQKLSKPGKLCSRCGAPLRYEGRLKR